MLTLLGESSPRNYGSQESTQQKFAKFIDPIRPLIVGIIRKGISFMPWIPRDGSTDDPSVTSFIHELAIPRLNGIPRLLMHELGQWAEKDAEIAATIRQIFGQHHTVLHNASGTGKTRLVIEGLSHRWGFYILASEGAEGEGSYDLPTLLDLTLAALPGWCRTLPPPSHPRYQALVERNQALASHAFTCVIIARLLLLKEFLNIAIAEEGTLRPSHIKWWLHCQLDPARVFNVDIFQYCVELVLSTAAPDALRFFSSVYDEICTILRTQGLPDTLYCVLDEAQVALGAMPECFEETALRDIIRSWANLLPDLQFVVVGTTPAISRICRTSGTLMEWHVVNNTGGFDDPSVQAAYVRRYVPPSLIPDGLMALIWKWLRGRHRLTASLLIMFMMNGYKDPELTFWRYVKCLTGASRSPPIDIPLDPLQFHTVPSELYPIVNRIVARFLVHGQSTELSEEQSCLADELGRYRNGDTLPRVDEPLMILAAAQYVFAAPTAQPVPGDCKARFLLNPNDQDLGDYLALYIYYAFNINIPRRVIEFSGTPPEWATIPQVMALSLKGGTMTTLEFHKVLLLLPEHVAAPRVIFLMKTRDRKYAWVVVRVQEDRKAPPVGRKLKGSKRKPKKRAQFEPYAFGFPKVAGTLKKLYSFLPGPPLVTGCPYSLICVIVTDTTKGIPKNRPLVARDGYPVFRLSRAAIQTPISLKSELARWSSRAAEMLAKDINCSRASSPARSDEGKDDSEEDIS